MFSYFTLLKKGKKGQIFPVLIVIAVILIIVALITANLGKVSLDRLNCIQGADAGALAGISDFTCGYNKASWAHFSMELVSIAIQIYLLIPMGYTCYGLRSIWAFAAGLFNYNMYDWAYKVVRGYSEAVRKDAYYYALINAGIDDKYKWDPDESQYRDKPHPDESWEHWTNLKSAFSKWLNDLADGWEDASSLSYEWQNQSKQVTIDCESSPPEELGYQAWCLFGLYWTRVGKFCMLLPWPHAPFPFYAWLEDPSERWVRITAERNYQIEEREVGGWTDTEGVVHPGFWSVRHPDTSASARAEMTGSFWGGPDDFDFELTE